MLIFDDGLKIAAAGLYMDSRVGRPRCFVSHAHSDHLAEHAETIASPITLRLARRRGALRDVVELEYGRRFALHDETSIRLLPAGHILGSAMLKYTAPEGSLLYTGDFKLRQSLTAEPAEPEPADVLVTECTYGLPHFRFPARAVVVEELVERVRGALRDNRQPVVLGYSLGKSQEIARILTDAGVPVTLHGAAFAMTQIYEESGMHVGAVRAYRREDFHGPAAVDLHERGALVGPPSAARTSFVTAFDDPCRIILTGWALDRNAKYRYGVDHALPLSDHADFDELLELVERVGAKKIYTHHGFRAFADELRRRGHDAEPARPDPQLSLFH